MEIRPYRDSDYDSVRAICIHTATAPEFVKDGELVCTLFCDYYVEKEPQNAYVLDDGGVAVGYILSAENYKNYIKTYRRQYLKKAAALNKAQARLRRLSFTADKIMAAKGYPAHLHIDILPSYQRGGWGTKMMDTLLSHLRVKGVKGVWLGVSAQNEKGVNFYTKYGFSPICSIAGTKFFGINLA